MRWAAVVATHIGHKGNGMHGREDPSRPQYAMQLWPPNATAQYRTALPHSQTPAHRFKRP